MTLTKEELESMLLDIDDLENGRAKNKSVEKKKERTVFVYGENKAPIVPLNPVLERPTEESIRCSECSKKIYLIAFLKEGRKAAYYYYCEVCNFYIPYEAGKKRIH